MKKLLILYLLILSFTVSAKNEKILFNLKYGMVKGGEAEIIITDTVFNSKPAIHYYLVVRTTGLTNALFGVNDVYESIVDADSRLPLKAIRNIKEKKYKWYNETLFYHNIDSLNSQRSGWREMPENMVDLVSSFFYFVNKHLMDDVGTGTKVTLPTFHADKIEEVTIKFVGEQLVHTDLGDTETYVLAPIVDKGKLLKRSDSLKLYISKVNKVPILFDFDMKIGSLKAILKSYKIDGVEQIASS